MKQRVKELTVIYTFIIVKLLLYKMSCYHNSSTTKVVGALLLLKWTYREQLHGQETVCILKLNEFQAAVEMIIKAHCMGYKN